MVDMVNAEIYVILDEAGLSQYINRFLGVDQAEVRKAAGCIKGIMEKVPNIESSELMDLYETLGDAESLEDFTSRVEQDKWFE